jgi:Enoyl-CoA hydratase/isomerase
MVQTSEPWCCPRAYLRSSLPVSIVSYPHSIHLDAHGVCQVADREFWDSLHTEPARRAIGIRKRLTDFQNAIGAPERCPFPVISAVHGPVIGLGIDMVSYCDIRYASSDATFCIKVATRLTCLFALLISLPAGSRCWFSS